MVMTRDEAKLEVECPLRVEIGNKMDKIFRHNKTCFIFFVAVFRRAFDDEHFDITVVNGPGSYSMEAVATFSQYS